MTANRLKIISDGTQNGTRLVDDHGRTVAGVTDIEWEIHIGMPAIARITLRGVQCEIEGERDDVLGEYRQLRHEMLRQRVLFPK